ncbi:TAXI family TRAP transporter solute-binding subunit [Azospirillum sp. ST 5-10]|uniref:TAXI family TRAP transporter solute-binding subunit n=1 Tax=unclassified Azospirillum TaxID=2630922 RepID=UPI003F4A4E51
MKRTLCALALAACLGAAPAAPAAAAVRQITIGTNPAGTIANVVGAGVAKLLQEKLGIRSAVEPHGGTSSYLPLLDSGELTLGVFIGVDLGLAARGEAPYSAPARNIRPVARMMRLDYGYVARTDSGLTSVADLKGKRVVVGIKSNIVLEKVNEAALATAGLTRADVQTVSAGGLEQGLADVVEGRADASALALGIPILREAHASVPGGMTVLALGERATDAVVDAIAAGARIGRTVPSPTNVGVGAPMPSMALELYLVAGPTVDEETGYRIARTIHENWDRLQAEVPALKRFAREDLATKTSPVPYADGAARFYAEVGAGQ